MNPIPRRICSALVLVNFLFYFLAEFLEPTKSLGRPLPVLIPNYAYIGLGWATGVAMLALWRTTLFHWLTVLSYMVLFFAVYLYQSHPYVDRVPEYEFSAIAIASVCGIPILIVIDGLMQLQKNRQTEVDRDHP
jgi:hypothetical protein